MDMREINLNSKFDIATVLFGGFGYLLKTQGVRKFFSVVRKVLNPGGLLVFEFWHNAAILPATRTTAGLRDFNVAKKGNTLIIRLNTSRYDTHSNMDTITFDFYIIEMIRKRLVDSFSETHAVKTYSISEMRRLLKEANFQFLAFYQAGVGRMSGLKSANRSTFRVLAVAKAPHWNIQSGGGKLS